MIAGYKGQIGDQVPYWFCKVAGADRKFIRVIAGVALPILERTSGAVIVLGELYRSTGSPDLIALGASVGEWGTVENALAQFRRDLKFDHVIVDREEAREIMFRLPGLQHGLSEIPLVTYSCESYAVTEVGRAKVDSMIADGRLHVDEIRGALDREPEQGLRALAAAVVWMQEWKAYYPPARKRFSVSQNILGVEGL